MPSIAHPCIVHLRRLRTAQAWWHGKNAPRNPATTLAATTPCWKLSTRALVLIFNWVKSRLVNWPLGRSNESWEKGGMHLEVSASEVPSFVTEEAGTLRVSTRLAKSWLIDHETLHVAYGGDSSAYCIRSILDIDSRLLVTKVLFTELNSIDVLIAAAELLKGQVFGEETGIKRSAEKTQGTRISNIFARSALVSAACSICDA